MKTALFLLQDLEKLYELQKEGGITQDEFQSAKNEMMTRLIDDDMLSARHLKLAHNLFSENVLSREEYDLIKQAALKLKLPQKPMLKKEDTAFSIGQVLLYLYKLLLFGVSFVLKLFLGIINFFIINLVIDNIKKR